MIHFNNFISPETMDAVMFFVKATASIFVGFFLASLLRPSFRKKVKDKYARAKEKNHEKSYETMEGKRAADALEDKMLALGIKYRCGANFSPFDYMALRLGLGLLGAILSAFLNPWFMPIAFSLVFFFVPVYFKQQDGNDNEAMMTDIGRMNSITALQLKNGVPIDKVLYECLRTIEHPRLREAIRTMSSEIRGTSTVTEAAKHLRKKFNNQYIDTYSKVLEQMDETGMSLMFFDDIAASVDRINEAIAIIEEQKAERTSSFFQLILFLAPLMIVFYILAGSLSGSGLW